MKMLRFKVMAMLLFGLFYTHASSDAQGLPPRGQAKAARSAPATSAAAGAEEQLSPEEKQKRKDWHESMLSKAVPKKGCFNATYPTLEWREVQCVAPPPKKVRFNVGGTNGDYAALRALPLTNVISSATGSFPTVTGVHTESDSISGVSDAYTLQLNTNNFFTTTSADPVCPTAVSPNQCRGFQQFIFENTNGNVFMEYFLSIPGASMCPPGWGMSAPAFPGYLTCTEFSPQAMHLGSQPITNLQSLSLTGTATAGGNDTVFLGTASMMAAMNTDSVLNLASSGWVAAEFNIFGACCGSTANFNSNSTITVNTTIHYGGTAAPGCFMKSFTQESNNLNLVGAPVLGTQPSPAIEFIESNKPGGAAACAAAAGIGDVHMQTFNGLFYDFQAAGDFTLAEAGQDFSVQTRQVSGAPTWPNATVNKAVAARFGSTKVAVCLPSEIHVDGKLTTVEDGKTLDLPGGVRITRQGNLYQITSKSGDSLTATVNPTWINVAVGLGAWPAEVHGVLANPNGNVNQIETREGMVLTNPFSFNDLYHRFADSWRVSGDASMLSVCGERVETGIPQQPFYANDLEPGIREKAQGVCTAAGVKPGPLQDACTLDVAVIGNDAAAQVFVDAIPPAAVGTITGGGGGGIAKWWWLLLVLLTVILIVWLLMRKKP